MSEPVFVDTDRLSKISPQVDELMRRITAAHASLIAGTGPLSDAAGDDAPGKVFNAAISESGGQIIDATGALGKVSGSVNLGINTMVHGYTSTEEDNTVKAPRPE